ncbi:hypothetical protein ABBQ38_011323 [Trebouxia sp. C0009 RCD-2024]
MPAMLSTAESSLSWCLIALIAFALLLVLSSYRRLMQPLIPTLSVSLTDVEAQDSTKSQYTPTGSTSDGKIPCYDPGSMQFLGHMPAMDSAQVKRMVNAAHIAAEDWKHSSFEQRTLLLKAILKYTVEHQQEICRVSSIDSGKTAVDAALGEVMVTCEKIWWLVKHGRRWLKPEYRSAGIMMFYKSARVEYHPVGVVGAIVPWNYPFHNVFNPLSAAVFAGNAIVIKVSEHASWSSLYYGRIITAALASVGAPENLVQIVTGYAEAGNALVTSGVNKLIFVGSTEIGRKVMQAAAQTLTPVVLELGGKDAFIVCDDADLTQAVPVALKGAFFSCGQNCAGAERFFVQEGVYDAFVQQVVDTTARMRQGPAVGGGTVDCGAMCMPGLAEKVGELVDNAVQHGAKVLTGGHVVRHPSGGQFFAPTVLVDVTPDMRIWREEVFGPVFTIVKFQTDADAIALANDCPFGLGSTVFSRSKSRANKIARQLQAGMTSINDFGSTYMCQSLPFGGVKDSGFDRFAGIEGLRGLCVPKAVCQDRFPAWTMMRTDIPPILQYPLSDKSFQFACALVSMFYSPSLLGNLRGLQSLLSALLPGGTPKAAQKQL